MINPPDAGAIGLFDSGVGGLSVWREVVALLPQARTVYVADQTHAPYGSRQLAEVQVFSEGITRFLLEAGAQLIVLACNTASAAALYYLRACFPYVPFVGMEPAVKPAVAQTRSGVIGVLATPATFEGELFANLLDRYAGSARVLTQTCPGLVEAVEAGALDTPETEARLRGCLEPLLAAGIDQLVLGCTHYPFLSPLIVRIVGNSVALLDPAPAVARQTARVWAQMRPDVPRKSYHPASTCGPARHVFYTTGPLRDFSAALERLVPPAAETGAVRAAGWDCQGVLRAL
jgi:glutamate racemase